MSSLESRRALVVTIATTVSAACSDPSVVPTSDSGTGDTGLRGDAGHTGADASSAATDAPLDGGGTDAGTDAGGDGITCPKTSCDTYAARADACTGKGFQTMKDVCTNAASKCAGSAIPDCFCAPATDCYALQWCYFEPCPQ